MTGAPADADRVYLLRPSVPPASVRAPAIWFAVLAAGVSAIALVDPTAAAVVAFFGVGLLVAALHPGLVAPYLVLATPLGYWHPQIAGVQMPVLEMAALGAALGCVPRAVAGGGSGDRLTGADIAFAALVGGV
ncbi:MAG: hypothetical protein ACRDLR_00900, partial [Gaiellaceae bacterium]